MLTEGEQLVVRAVFDAEGDLEAAEPLAGAGEAAWELTRGIELKFIGDTQHRVVVYAVFQGGPRVQLTAAVPTYVQCCCDGFLCPQ